MYLTLILWKCLWITLIGPAYWFLYFRVYAVVIVYGKVFVLWNVTNVAFLAISFLMLTDFCSLERLRSNLTFVVICLRILYVYDFSVFFFWVEYLGICFWVSHGILSLVFICISQVSCLSPDLQLISSLFSWSSMKYYSTVLINFLESKLGRF